LDGVTSSFVQEEKMKLKEMMVRKTEMNFFMVLLSLKIGSSANETGVVCVSGG
jgi:hypothetical protein